MPQPNNTSSNDLDTPSPTVGDSIRKALSSNSEWPDKEEFLDVIYWGRQILGIIFGVLFGVIGVKGAIGVVGFAGINAAVLYIYWTAFQQVDEETYGGSWEMTKEGFMTSFAGFLVAWIILYTGLHID